MEVFVGGMMVALVLALLAKLLALLLGRRHLQWWRVFAYGASVTVGWALLWDVFIPVSEARLVFVLLALNAGAGAAFLAYRRDDNPYISIGRLGGAVLGTATGVAVCVSIFVMVLLIIPAKIG